MADIPKGAFTAYAADQCLAGPFKQHSLATQNTIQKTIPGRRVITLGSALAITILAPIAGVDDGILISIISATAFAHTLTCTGHLKDGNGHSNVMTLAAQPGAGFTIVAWNGNWLVVSANFATGS
jgi:hypothetical protein